MKINPLPSIEHLRLRFEISKSSPTGLIWRNRPKEDFAHIGSFKRFMKLFAGKPAGYLTTDCRSGKQYYNLRIDGVAHRLHRVVSSLDRNEVISTEIQIDHEDNNSLNNKPSNLRLALHAENIENVNLKANNTSGAKGVFYRKSNGTWWGRVTHLGLKYYTGTSPSKEIITEMVRELRESLHKEFCNHG